MERKPTSFLHIPSRFSSPFLVRRKNNLNKDDEVRGLPHTHETTWAHLLHRCRCLTAQRDQTAECLCCPGRGGEASAWLFQESALEKSCKPLPALSSLNGFCRINLLFLLNGGYSEWEEVSSQGTGLTVESPWERQLVLHWAASSRGPLNVLLKGSECRLYPVHQSAGQREKRQTALQVTGYHAALARSCSSSPWGLC